MHWRLLVSTCVVAVGIAVNSADAAEQLRIATFNVDATPPIGSAVAYALARKIDDPLSARGIVLIGGDKPIVLCAVDWIGIANGGQDVWREKLAQAAGTTADHVCVHALHQHDGPRCDFEVSQLMADHGLDGQFFDAAFARSVVENVALQIKEAMVRARPITHIGLGQAKVEKVASNRRILGPDGKVKAMRFSSCRDDELIAAPEGVIDPFLKLVSFWDGDTPVASLTYYATHPQSYYGKGDVTSEFVGIAREQRAAALPSVAHIHFNGAGGNIAAGKYNDGSPERRPVLASRMEAGMKAAWESVKKEPISGKDISWDVVQVSLPVAEHLKEDDLAALVADPDVNPKRKLGAAHELTFLRRMKAGHLIDIGCLKLGRLAIIHMPGELFVEYQLAAQKMSRQHFVCMAAYGEYGPSYIGTKIAYGQGGYETSERASNTSPEVEKVLMNAMKQLLK